MIIVIADDFTGAAELAGIGLRYNLSVQLCMPGIAYNGADLLVISTNSRSMNRQEAMTVTERVIKDIRVLKPELLYKKTDSVMRGHVLDELELQMKITGKNKMLYIPANPSLGRIIKNGTYYINQVPVAATAFAHDPEFSVRHSSVLKMIGDENGKIIVRKYTETLPEKGIVIGEAETGNDLQKWVAKAGTAWSLAGAAEFFAAIMEARGKAIPQQEVVAQSPCLYVSGTTFEKSKILIREIQEQQNTVVYIPETALQNEKDAGIDIVQTIKEMLVKHNRCVLAVQEKDTHTTSPVQVRNKLAGLVKQLLKQQNIQELFIEGGATAGAILEAMEWKDFTPVSEWQPGVVRMKINDQYLTVKPGSYQWTPQIESLFI